MAGKPLIVAHDLWKSYGKHQVLRGLNLEIYEGETLVILGRSGEGKSVLLRQIIGIESPDKGYVEVSGKKIHDLPQSRRMQAIMSMGMLFQGAALFDSMNVGENTAFYLRQHEKISEEEIQQRVDEALATVGLKGIQSKMPSDLSGGMRKRAALARLIVYRPSIVLYDEPTTGLDPVTAMQINELIGKTQKELQATSVVVTHDIRSAIEVGDRIAFQHDGVIREIAPKEEFLQIQDPKLQAYFQNAILTEKYFEEHQRKGP